MSRPNLSTIATHPNRAEIELAAANDISCARIAETYGCSKHAVWRWKQKMSPERKALLRYKRGTSPIDLQRLREGESEALLQRIVIMLAETYACWSLAVETKDFNAATQLGRLHARYIEIEGRILGELGVTERHLHVNVTDSPAFRKLVALVMSWVANDPDKAAQLSTFLEEQERAEAARDVTPKVTNGAGTSGQESDSHTG